MNFSMLALRVVSVFIGRQRRTVWPLKTEASLPVAMRRISPLSS
jgi:hypothetical protein